MRNELHIFLSCLHRLTQCSRMFLARDQKCLCLLEDTAGELSPSAPSPRSGEGWGEAAALWILLANSLRLLPLHAVERAGARKLRGSFTKAAALWIRQQYPEGWRPQGARQFHTTELH